MHARFEPPKAAIGPATAGQKDERWGQRVVAFVRRLREYLFVREAPESPAGQVLRRKPVTRALEPASPLHAFPPIPPA